LQKIKLVIGHIVPQGHGRRAFAPGGCQRRSAAPRGALRARSGRGARGLARQHAGCDPCRPRARVHGRAVRYFNAPRCPVLPSHGKLAAERDMPNRVTCGPPHAAVRMLHVPADSELLLGRKAAAMQALHSSIAMSESLPGVGGGLTCAVTAWVVVRTLRRAGLPGAAWGGG